MHKREQLLKSIHETAEQLIDDINQNLGPQGASTRSPKNGWALEGHKTLHGYTRQGFRNRPRPYSLDTLPVARVEGKGVYLGKDKCLYGHNLESLPLEEWSDEKLAALDEILRQARKRHHEARKRAGYAPRVTA